MPSFSLYSFFSGLSLLSLIGIPTFVPALHELLHYHQHLHCVETASDVHLHADIYECNLCDYLATFTFLNNTKDDITYSQETLTAISCGWTDPFVHMHTSTQRLRGPPVELL